jgi:uncharacterized membrane protein YraQ (UPF0718 family)
MNWKNEGKIFSIIASVFFACYFLPVGTVRFDAAVLGSLDLVKWYAREHVLLCLVPAFFIAGAIGVFVSQAAVMKYLGAKANKFLAYGVAAVSGTILAVCSCTVLPLFAGIYKKGAGLGPATAFLYSGPAINVLAIILTARILGVELGIARALGAILFSVIIGLLMHLIFRKEETAKAEAQLMMPEPEVKRPLWQEALYFASMVGILVFANWGKPAEASGLWFFIFSHKWMIAGGFAIMFALTLMLWFELKWWQVLTVGVIVEILALLFPGMPLLAFVAGAAGLVVICAFSKTDTNEWLYSSWGFAKQIMPLLLIGVLISGFLLGAPGGQGIIPGEWVSAAVGGNSIQSNFFASIAGAFMYFATLTEVPILQGLIQNGMGKGPALALLLAGPALSLPNMLVIRSVMGTKKTVVYVSLVVVMATFSGMIYGSIF